MDYYQGWFDLKPGVRDSEFARDLARYMTHLKDHGLIEGWRLARRKLGLGPPEFAEFHLVMETRDLAQLDQAFSHVAARDAPVEGVHFNVNSKVQNLRFGLYRDFPDAVRREGEEKF